MQKRWWLFHATDFQTLMYPCFTVGRILGMFPYKINALIFEISKSRFFLSTMVVCLYCIIVFLSIYDFIITERSSYDDIVFYLGYLCRFTCECLTVIVTHILTNPRMRFLQTISEIYSKLPSESRRMLSRLIHTKDILGIIFLILHPLIAYSNMNIEMNWDFIFLLSQMFSYILLYQLNMLYMNCICVLKASLKNINDDLMYFQSDMINEIEPPVSSSICLMRKNQLFLIEVKVLMKQHLTISETVQKFNLIFSLQLLSFAILTTYTMVCGLFIIGYGLDFNVNFMTFLAFLYLMSYVSQITLIAWACETCKNQAHEIGITVCNVYNTIRDEQIKNELRLFSLQVLHHKNIFSIKGLSVDATLLTSIVSISTTYLFLLIQFLDMERSCR